MASFKQNIILNTSHLYEFAPTIHLGNNLNSRLRENLFVYRTSESLVSILVKS